MAGLTREEFEKVVEEAYAELPGRFRTTIDNLYIVVEDRPPEHVALNKGIRARGILLGLYEGVPLPHRGTGYGTFPVLPDKITLFRENLEQISRNEAELVRNIVSTLIHEIGHYFGMTEKQIRDAGY